MSIPNFPTSRTSGWIASRPSPRSTENHGELQTSWRASIPCSPGSVQRTGIHTRQQFAPEAGDQEFLFNRIVHAARNQHRCFAAEVAQPSSRPAPHEELERKPRLLATYATRAERSFHKYVKELRSLQNEARYRRKTASAQSEASVLTEVQKVDQAVDNTQIGPRRPARLPPPRSLLAVGGTNKAVCKITPSPAAEWRTVL